MVPRPCIDINLDFIVILTSIMMRQVKPVPVVTQMIMTQCLRFLRRLSDLANFFLNVKIGFGVSAHSACAQALKSHTFYCFPKQIGIKLACSMVSIRTQYKDISHP